VIQGIMTGIGFLGAGVIFKQGFFNVAGLTTAASLWFTAALGIIYGLGFYYPAVLATFAVLFTLATLRWLEWRVMRQCFARLTLCFAKGHIMSQDELERILAELGFTIHQVDYRQTGSGAMFEYKMVVSTFALKTSRRWREPWLVCLTSLISTSRPPRNSAEPSKKAALLVIYRGPHDSCGVEA
jgi:putative Mg2+ transporter-C (MgtC) family protein